jgi:outer membrane receptor protein involved in Fe transport
MGANMSNLKLHSQWQSPRVKNKLFANLAASTALIATGWLLPALEVHAADAAATDDTTGKQSAKDDGSTELDKVVVRSRNRLEPLKDVPLSISVVTGKELEREGAFDTIAITKRAANVQWNTGNPRQGSLSIRGIGKQAQTDAQDPSVGVIVDGVNYAYNPLSSYDFLDVDTVEVSRGPQGTLLGKGATLGVINITTRRPSFKPDSIYSITFGENNTVIGRFAGGGPVIDDLLAWRGSFYVDKQKGAFDNLYEGGGDRSYTDKNRIYGRVQLLYTPADNFSARLSVDVTPRSGENTNGLTFYKDPPPFYSNGTPVNLANESSTRLARRWFKQESNYTYYGNYIGAGQQGAVNNDAQNPIYTGSNGGSLELNWNVGGFAVTSISAYKDYYFDARNDEGTPFNITFNSNTTAHYRQLSQEVRVNSAVGEFVDYQAGIFLLKTDNTVLSKQEYGSDAGAWLANATQYNFLDAIGADGNTNGRYLLENSLSRLFTLQTDKIDNKSAAAFGQLNWHFTDKLTVTTGARFTNENRNNQTQKGIKTNGYAAELDPAIVNGVVLGGFDSFYNPATTAVYVLNGNVVPAGTPGATQVAAGGYALTTDTGNPALVASANAVADAAALKYFNVATWAGLTGTQKRQLYYAQAIRKANLGIVYSPTQAIPFKKTQPAYVFSPSYKISDQFTTYVSWQYGEKAGIAQFTNGLPNNARPEKNTASELGLKSILFNKKLLLNADVFVNNITDYQQSVRVLDVYTTTLRNDGTLTYASATGNVPKVQVKGLELDGAFNGIPYTSLRFNAAYNNAVYRQFPNSGQPSENGYTGAPPYQDVSGQTVPGAPKVTASVGAEFRLPVLNNKEFHSSFNTFYTSKYNSDNTLSVYGWVDPYTLTDFSIGIGRKDSYFDISFIVQNAFDTRYRAQGFSSYTPSLPRWYGVQVSGRL